MNTKIINKKYSCAGHLILFLLVTYSGYCKGQKEVFYENVFKKEFSALNKEYSDLKKEWPENNRSINEMRISSTPEILPDWFVNTPACGNDVIYAIGISDPWMDGYKGNIQALSRASGIASLMCKLSTRGVVETYNSNLNNKFQQISQFVAIPRTIIKVDPLDSFKTKYDEHIFLFKISLGKTSEDKTTIEYFISSDDKEVKNNQFEKLRLKSNANSLKSEYESIEVNENRQIKSILNTDTIHVVPATYRYSIRDRAQKDTLNPEICLLTCGLWQGYLKSLVNNLDIMASDISPKMKSLLDNKESEESINNLKHLIRTIYDVSFSFSITSVKIKRNELGIQIKQVNNANMPVMNN